MKLSRNPIAYIGAAIVILQIAQAVITGEPITQTAFDSLLVAIGAIIGHRSVTPNKTVQEKVTRAAKYRQEN